MARIRRKPRVVWLPASTERSFIPSSATTLIGTSFVISGPAGNFATQASPIVVDVPAGSTTDATLSDFEGSAYRLRRIVGKIFAGIKATEFTVEPGAIIFYAGFIVLRVDTAGNPLAGIANLINYHPGLLEAERDPWIWRRSWLLGNRIVDAPSLPGIEGFNTAHGGTWDYGSVADGPHVDAKTARIISDEERLFLITGATALGGTQGAFATVTWCADLRVLASMKTSSGNRRNASR